MLLAFAAPDPSATDTVLGQLLANVPPVSAGFEQDGFCPPGMASIDGLYCIDRFEASLVEILPNGAEQRFAPFAFAGHHGVRAVSEPDVFPQAFISATMAEEACAHSRKRLCKPTEWRKACMGRSNATYSYGNDNEPKRCNDSGKSPLTAIYGNEVVTSSPEKMNDPALGQIPGSVAKAGAFSGCVNDYGVHDMVGNLHEWVDDSEGTFLGGYYLDTHINGEGCRYSTVAHAAFYHDYSTGFRCCADRQFEAEELVELEAD